MMRKTRLRFRIPEVLRFGHLTEVVRGALGGLDWWPRAHCRLLCTQQLKCPSDVRPPPTNTAAS